MPLDFRTSAVQVIAEAGQVIVIAKVSPIPLSVRTRHCYQAAGIQRRRFRYEDHPFLISCTHSQITEAPNWNIAP